jgi:long-chain acyl-CoA synthetase
MDKIIDNIKTSRPTLMMAVPRIFEKIYAKVIDQVSQGSNIKKSVFEWAKVASKKYFDSIDEDRAPKLQDILQRELAYKIVFSKIYEKFGGRVRFFVSGGAPLSSEIMQFLRYANLTILEGYGLTETVAPCVLSPVYKQNVGTVGIPIGDVELKFASDGEILIKTKAMLREYYKNPEATKESIQNGWFHSGDIGILTEEGYLKITDRKKDIIITSGGKNVAPQRIENIMKIEKYIGQILIAGDKQKYLAAVITLDKTKFVDELEAMGLNPNMTYEELAQNDAIKAKVEEAIAHGNKELAQYETVKKFWIAPDEWTVENGALTPSLKLKKKVLFQRYAKEFDDLFRGE